MFCFKKNKKWPVVYINTAKSRNLCLGPSKRWRETQLVDQPASVSQWAQSCVTITFFCFSFFFFFRGLFTQVALGNRRIGLSFIWLMEGRELRWQAQCLLKYWVFSSLESGYDRTGHGSALLQVQGWGEQQQRRQSQRPV